MLEGYRDEWAWLFPARTERYVRAGVSFCVKTKERKENIRLF